MLLTLGDVVVFVLVGSTLLGSLLFLLKVFIGQILEMKLSPEKTSGKKTLIAKMLLILLMIFFAIWLLVFLIILCFFPDLGPQIPFILKLLGAFGLLVYWGCFAGLALGLGKVVGAGSGSATRILKELFAMISKSTSETTQKAEKPKIANNSESGRLD